MIGAMDRSAPTPPIATTFRQRIFADAALLPLPVYRDFIEMLYSMRLPIFGLGAVFVGIAILVGLGQPLSLSARCSRRAHDNRKACHHRRLPPRSAHPWL